MQHLFHRYFGSELQTYQSGCSSTFCPSDSTPSGGRSILLQDSVDPVSGHSENRRGPAAQVPDAAVARLALEPLGGAVLRQAVEVIGAAVPGL